MMENPVSIGVVSTHADLTAQCRQVGQVPGARIMVYEGALESCLTGLLEFEQKGVEVIVTSEGNTLFVKDNTHIPVISIPQNTFDTFYPMAKAAKQYGPKLTLFSYRKPPANLSEIADLLGFQPNVAVFTDTIHLESLLEQLHDLDQVIIGGGFVCQLASGLGFITERINLSRESLISTLDSARELVLARRGASEEAFRLNAILDWAYEGIVATDDHGTVTLFNRAAEKFFNLKAEAVIGRNCREALPAAKLHEVLINREPALGEVVQVGSAKLAVNRVPIMNGSQISGVVANFQEVQAIQEIEEKIRKELTSKNSGVRYCFADIKGRSASVQGAVDLAQKYARTDETVLILGESGSGKEMFAQSMHADSKRKDKTFIAINCAAIPTTLLESELFGYCEGSFTGARRGGKPGLFELAHRGTIFLDEIGEMPMEVQAKLLRVIQEKEVRRVGGEKLVKVDVRIIAATHQDLYELVDSGRFRKDLFYRLDVLHLTVPPLRERKDDIPYLVTEILKQHSDLSARQKRVIIATVSTRNDYLWPGNVRELENMVSRLSVLTKGLSEPEGIAQARQMFNRHCGTKARRIPQHSDLQVNLLMEGSLKEIIVDVEKQVIRHTLDVCGGDRSKAANKLGIGRTTLWRKLEEGHNEPVYTN